MGWWSRLVPVSWKRTLWAAHLLRNASLWVESSPIRFGEVAVVWVAPGFGAEDRDDLVGDVVQVVVEAPPSGGRGTRTGPCSQGGLG